ncbi:hypothetical protein B0F90DRAFT_1751523 [Multifurca ochricompacta]|uniref:Uncharacterized protein n=1 Tax=Multifurca ochricompacta TaxID=376703 RepID=A0AAD4LYG6_9AGAM|nr:hypothetical protein B0F90DRAFT_1751523 [Multifurca ochricompacta]
MNHWMDTDNPEFVLISKNQKKNPPNSWFDQNLLRLSRTCEPTMSSIPFPPLSFDAM